MKRSIQAVWNQEDIPVILRRTGKGELLRVRLPFDQNNRRWLQNMRRTPPIWIASRKFWEIPKAWFNDIVNRALKKYGRIYVIQPFREQEICSPSCQNAQGHECQCSCMGVHHGAGSDGSWFEVSEAFSTRWGERELACRLMVKKNSSKLPRETSLLFNANNISANGSRRRAIAAHVSFWTLPPFVAVRKLST